MISDPVALQTLELKIFNLDPISTLVRVLGAYLVMLRSVEKSNLGSIYV